VKLLRKANGFWVSAGVVLIVLAGFFALPYVSPGKAALLSFAMKFTPSQPRKMVRIS
jgi:hypothetical protein